MANSFLSREKRLWLYASIEELETEAGRIARLHSQRSSELADQWDAARDKIIALKNGNESITIEINLKDSSGIVTDTFKSAAPVAPGQVVDELLKIVQNYVAPSSAVAGRKREIKDLQNRCRSLKQQGNALADEFHKDLGFLNGIIQGREEREQVDTLGEVLRASKAHITYPEDANSIREESRRLEDIIKSKGMR